MSFHEYPYTNFHEMNLDWVVKKVKELAAAWAQVQQDWTDEQAAFANLQSWIENYFNNLDVQTEINVKIDAMVAAGTMSELIAPYVASGLPAEVADQIGDVVAAQIGPVVAAQIGAVVADQLPAVAAAAAAQEVSAWLALHVNPETGYVIDDTFTVQGAAADAKAVGDEFTAIKSALSQNTLDYNNYLYGDSVYVNKVNQPNSSWVTYPTSITLTANKPYVLIFDSDTLVTSGSVSFRTSDDTSIFTQSVSNKTHFERLYIPSENIVNPLIKVSLNFSGGGTGNIKIRWSGGSVGEAQKTSDKVDAISCLYGTERAIGRNKTLITSSSWVSSDYFSLQNGVHYQFYIKVSQNVNTNSTVRLMFNGSSVTSKTFRASDYTIFDYTPSSDLPLAYLSISINGVEYNVNVDMVYGLYGFVNEIGIFKTNDRVSKLEYDSPLYADYENFYTTANGAKLEKALVADRMDCTPSGIYGAHESNIYVYNDKIYLVFSANKTDSTEDQSKYNIELVKADLQGNVESHLAIASVNDVIGTETVTKCQAAFILPVGSTIHIYVDLYVTGGYKLWHTTYNCETGVVGSFDEVSYIDANGDSVKAEKAGEQYICSNWFSYNGHSYNTAVFFNAKNCGIAYTDDFTTFTFVKRLDDIGLFGAGGEMTASYYASWNKIMLVYRTPTDYSYAVFTQYDTANNVWESWRKLPDATARPMFFNGNSNIYLATNAPYTRKEVTIWKYATDTWSHLGTLIPVSVAKMANQSTYFSFCEYNGSVYMAFIGNTLKKICVSVIPLETVTDAMINAKMLEMF